MVWLVWLVGWWVGFRNEPSSKSCRQLVVNRVPNVAGDNRINAARGGVAGRRIKHGGRPIWFVGSRDLSSFLLSLLRRWRARVRCLLSIWIEGGQKGNPNCQTGLHTVNNGLATRRGRKKRQETKKEVCAINTNEEQVLDKRKIRGRMKRSPLRSKESESRGERLRYFRTRRRRRRR